QVFCWPDLTPYHDQFPTDSSKVAFAVSFMTEYAATWSQPYLMRVFNAKGVFFDQLLDDFKSIFFDHNHQHRAEVALKSLGQTGTLTAYIQELNSHACNVGWVDTPLMILYNEKHPVHLLHTMQAMALKAGQTIEGIRNGRPTPIPSSSAPTTDPNAMDLSAFPLGDPHNPLSDAKRNRRLQLNLCFRCGQAGHFSHGCSYRNRKLQ
ncbi:uncharacterized protein VP01_9207g1, partial [Puccinia sorghi]